jgi:hypothetical protein
VTISGKDRAWKTFNTKEQAIQAAEVLIEDKKKAFIVIRDDNRNISRIIYK